MCGSGGREAGEDVITQPGKEEQMERCRRGEQESRVRVARETDAATENRRGRLGQEVTRRGGRRACGSSGREAGEDAIAQPGKEEQMERSRRGERHAKVRMAREVDAAEERYASADVLAVPELSVLAGEEPR